MSGALPHAAFLRDRLCITEQPHSNGALTASICTVAHGNRARFPLTAARARGLTDCTTRCIVLARVA